MTVLRWVIEAAGLLLVAGCWLTVGRNYYRLPPSVPVHFGLNGRPNSWARRPMIWLLPIIAVAEFVALGAVAFSAPAASWMMLSLQLVTVLLLYVIVRDQVRVAMQVSDRLSSKVWFVVGLLVVVLVMLPRMAGHH